MIADQILTALKNTKSKYRILCKSLTPGKTIQNLW